jgi:hypothetical protein
MSAPALVAMGTVKHVLSTRSSWTDGAEEYEEARFSLYATIRRKRISVPWQRDLVRPSEFGGNGRGCDVLSN